MSSSKLSNFYNDNSKEEVKICNVECSDIRHEDINNVKALIKYLNKKHLTHSIIIFLFSLLALFMTYSTLKEEGITKESLFLIVMTLIFTWLLIHVASQIRSSKNYSYKKAQYGIVKSKFEMKVTAKSTSNKEYYVNVSFPNTESYIRRVICTPKTYNILNEGGHVLVISFDNKKVYAVPCNE